MNLFLVKRTLSIKFYGGKMMEMLVRYNLVNFRKPFMICKPMEEGNRWHSIGKRKSAKGIDYAVKNGIPFVFDDFARKEFDKYLERRDNFQSKIKVFT